MPTQTATDDALAALRAVVGVDSSDEDLLKHQEELEVKEEGAVAEVPAKEKEEKQEEVLEHPEAPLSRLILSPTALEIDSIPLRKSSMVVKKDPQLRSLPAYLPGSSW